MVGDQPSISKGLGLTPQNAGGEVNRRKEGHQKNMNYDWVFDDIQEITVHLMCDDDTMAISEE